MESGFSTQDIEIIFASDLSCAKTLQAIRWISPDGITYEFPQFQPTDFASTPKEVWGFPLYLIPTGWWAIPALGHDSFFQNLALVVNLDGTKQLANLTEAMSNQRLLEMMQSIKPNPTIFEKTQMDAIFEGVTLGGWHAYKQDRS